jgi:PAS domain S-box-containing protein
MQDEAKTKEQLIIELRERVAELEKDKAKRKRTEEALQQSEREKAILNQIANVFLTIPDEKIYEEVLAVILKAFKCRYGVFGYIGDSGDLIIPSMTKEIWSDCQVEGKSMVFPRHLWGGSIWGRAIKEKKSFSSEGPFQTPEGHLPVYNFLTVPIVFADKTIGLASGANKDGGFSEEDKAVLERIAAYLSPILNTRLQRDRQELERKRMEEALRGAWLYTRSLIEASLDPLVTISREGKITDVNEATIKLTGLRRRKLIGTDISTYFTEPELAHEGYRRAFEKGFVTDYPLTIKHSNGKLTHVLYNASVYKNEAGKVMGVFAAARDITERKQAEESLILSEDRYRRLFEDAVLGIYRSTPTGKILSVNPAFARMYGFDSPEEAKSLVSDVAVDLYVDPSHRNDIVRMILDAKRPIHAESLYRRKDGSIFTGNLHVWAVRDGKGELLYLEGFVEDITERKRAEEALRESKAYLSATIECTPFEFWAMGPDGFYTMQNRFSRAIFGDIVGKRPEDVCLNQSMLSVWLGNNRRACSGELVMEEVKYFFGDQERYYYNVVAPIQDAGRTLGIVGISVDITDRKLLEMELKKVNEELESKVEERTKELGAKTRRLEEFNSAMKVLLKRREEDRTELEESILMNVKSLIIPYLEKLKKSRLNGDQMTYLKILESHMREITSPFTRKLSEKYFGLTPLEVQTASLIKEGKTTQEIAELLCVSENTVSSHRFHIRKKLGLGNKKINLRYYLQSLDK